MGDKVPALRALTSLRFFAAAAIVIVHLQGPIIPMKAIAPLTLGVSFFFVLSGFILAYVYQGGLNPKEFYISRFARLWPIHAVTIALTVWLLIPFVFSRPDWALPFTANVLLLHAWVPLVGYALSFNSVSWSISDELFFYLLFPFLRGRAFRLVVLLLVLVTIAGILAMELTEFPRGRISQGDFSPLHFVMQHPIMRVLEFAVGVGFGRLFVSRRIRSGTGLEVAVLLAVILFGVLCQPSRTLVSSLGWPHAARWYWQSGGMLVFAAAIYVFAHEQGAISRALQWRGLVRLGDISFCTYMFHPIVYKYAITQKWTESLGYAWTTVIVIAIIYCGSYVLWRLVEKPCRDWIISRGKRRPRKPAGRPELQVSSRPSP